MNASTLVMGLNGIDFLMAIVITAVVYIRRKDGVVAELVKSLGIFCMVFITLHYYARFADFLRVQFFGQEVKTEFFAFCLLSVSIFLGFVFISSGWTLILEIKSFEIVDRLVHVVFSLVRGCFICSMIFLALILSRQEFLASRVKKSISGLLLSGVAVEIYRVSYSSLVEKIFPGEKINEAIFELIGKKSGKTKNSDQAR